MNYKRSVTSTFLLILATTLSSPLESKAAEEAEFPKRKPGLWESQVKVSSLGKPQTTKECISAETDKKMMMAGQKGVPGGDCQTSFSKDGSSFVIEVSCSAGGIKMNSKTVMSGDFQSSYTGKGTMTFEGGPMKMPAQTLAISSKYKGACPAKMKPGDIETSGLPGQQNITINVVDG